VTEPSYLAAIQESQESYGTGAADYAEPGKPPAELDPLSRAMPAALAEVVRVADRGPVADLEAGRSQTLDAGLARSRHIWRTWGRPRSALICPRR
jgi:hypothetical protein